MQIIDRSNWSFKMDWFCFKINIFKGKLSEQRNWGAAGKTRRQGPPETGLAPERSSQRTVVSKPVSVGRIYLLGEGEGDPWMGRLPIPPSPIFATMFEDSKKRERDEYQSETPNIKLMYSRKQCMFWNTLYILEHPVYSRTPCIFRNTQYNLEHPVYSGTPRIF